jgi:hypothetical protein
MTGSQLLGKYRQGEDFFVGREGGLSGKHMMQGLESGAWQSQPNETNREAIYAPNYKWFRLSEFVKLVLEKSGP